MVVRISSNETSKRIRAHLKKSFSGINFSVRKRDESVILVSWTDGPTLAQVSEITKMYEGATFDSSDDSKGVKTHVVDGVSTRYEIDWIQSSRGYSDALLECAIKYIEHAHAGKFAPPCGGGLTVEDYRSGKLIDVEVSIGASRTENFGYLVRQYLESDFTKNAA